MVAIFNITCEEEYKVVKVHFTYIVSILLCTIILVATSNWTDRDNFTDYLTNAATFVSLVLGIVAIVYSFIANSSLSKSLGSITQVSEVVQDSKSQISQFVSESSANTEMLKIVSDSFETKVQSLMSSLITISERTGTLLNAVNPISAQLDKLSEQVDKANSTTAIKMGANDNIQTKVNDADALEEYHDNFLRWSSLSGLFLLYACSKAIKADKEINLTDFKTITGTSPEYARGFLVASTPAAIVNATTDVKSDDVIAQVQFVSEKVSKSIYELSLKSINNVFKDDGSAQDRYHEALKNIEVFFDTGRVIPMYS